MDDLFQFEKEKCAELRRFPMHFRLKLDLCGIKLSKRDWNAFDLTEKRQLLAMPCETEQEVAAFRARLKSLIKACDGDSIEIEAIGQHMPWQNTSAVPASVRSQIDALFIPSPSLAQWTSLTDLQRFALMKLTREGHVKKEIRQVLEEFDLIP